MHTEPHDIHTPRNRHRAEAFEGLLQKAMVVVVVVLAVGMVWMLMTTDSTPSWMH